MRKNTYIAPRIECFATEPYGHLAENTGGDIDHGGTPVTDPSEWQSKEGNIWDGGTDDESMWE